MKSVAVIDLGTHNCRMSVADISENGFDRRRVYSKMVRLGEGASKDGRLQAQPMKRTLTALTRMSDIIYEEKITEIHAVATEGARMAKNAAEFFKDVKAKTGLDFKIISAGEEVRLSVMSTLPLATDAKRVLNFDIGGGSTEVILTQRTRRNLQILDWISLPYGVVRGRDRFGSTLKRDVYETFVSEVEAAFADFFQRNKKFMQAGYEVIGTSGTVTTLAALCMEMTRYNPQKIDGAKIELAKAISLARTSSAMPAFARRVNPLIGTGRADYLPSGCAIMEGIFQHIPSSTMIAADRGLREGLLYGLVPSSPKVYFKGEKP